MAENVLRIPLAEWLYRMTEAELPYQARALAIYAAVFKISSNDELGQLAGMASKEGTADRTYDKWKKKLLEEGWVIIRRRKGGRGLGIEVEPSYKETPVTFTDYNAKNPRKYYPRNEEDNTPAIPAEAAKVTPVIPADPVGITPVISAETPLPSRTRGEENNIIKTNTSVTEEFEDRGSGGKELSSDEDDQPTPRVALEAFELYNAMASRVGLPQARTLTPQRRKLIMARMREHGGLEAWKTALANIEKSKFLQGGNDRGWRADLEFLLQASRFTKVVEGTYGNGAHAGGAPAETYSDRIRRAVLEGIAEVKVKRGAP